MKNSTKLRIIDWVTKILKPQYPVIIKQEREVVQVQVVKEFSKFEIVNIRVEDKENFIRTNLIKDLMNVIKRDNLVEFVYVTNPHDSNLKYYATMKVVKPYDGFNVKLENLLV